MLGMIAVAYMAAGYYCFWQVLKQSKPRRPGSFTAPVAALVFGPLIFGIAVLRAIFDPYYQPVTVKFIEFEIDLSTGQLRGQYQTVWQTRRDLDTVQ